MLVRLEVRCCRIRSGSGAALHNCLGIEGIIASMYRKPKEIQAGDQPSDKRSVAKPPVSVQVGFYNIGWTDTPRRGRATSRDKLL